MNSVKNDPERVLKPASNTQEQCEFSFVIHALLSDLENAELMCTYPATIVKLASATSTTSKDEDRLRCIFALS